LAAVKQNITIEDVARAAGVSRQTVSRAINNKGEISPATQQRVLDAVQRLGYQPSRVAQGLATKRTFTIGFIISDITNPFFPNVARGVQDAARPAGYSVLFANSDEAKNEELRTLQTMSAQGVDGIVLFPHPYQYPEFTKFIEQFRPMVLINSRFNYTNVGHITTDNYGGARQVVDYLVGKGHTQIGMLNGLSGIDQPGQRLRGFLDGLQNHGLPANPNLILSGAPTLEQGYQAALRLLAEQPQITAIFAYNDLMAVSAIQACQTLGRRVPDDCAVIGFDDTRLASLVTPPLTTVRIDQYQLGQKATERLLAMIENPEAAFSPLNLPVELIVRESA